MVMRMQEVVKFLRVVKAGEGSACQGTWDHRSEETLIDGRMGWGTVKYCGGELRIVCSGGHRDRGAEN